jgi:predicted GH43/DUF377 family glycosyl hydrolase
MPITVNRSGNIFSPDPKRLIARYHFSDEEKSRLLIKRILDLPEAVAKEELIKVLRSYSKRHRSISKIFKNHFDRLHHVLLSMDIDPNKIEESIKVLIGSYFTKEYSIESAAFFNPSAVEDPDQSELNRGEKRIILSFRATGEGHISSLVFRNGIMDAKGNLTIEETGKMLDEAENILRHSYNKVAFLKSLYELQDNNRDLIDRAFEKLPDNFSYGQLETCVKETKNEVKVTTTQKIFCDEIMWLASSHYEIKFSMDTALSERVIFPISKNEKNGIEDARFVKFKDDNGEVTYYATYTAYDGINVLSKLIETKDFYHFKIVPINGKAGRNKGMAIFPRKINGKYAMLSRIDGINNYIAYSDKINRWDSATLLQVPKFPWEFVQIGNCGSPIETKEGWLILTHGVGQMREYVLGASLFDLDNPEKEIGRLQKPLLIANEIEREGYVPNVIYSCGSIVHNGILGIPYAMSDYTSSFATVDLEELLIALKRSK